MPSQNLPTAPIGVKFRSFKVFSLPFQLGKGKEVTTCTHQMEMVLHVSAYNVLPCIMRIHIFVRIIHGIIVLVITSTVCNHYTHV